VDSEDVRILGMQGDCYLTERQKALLRSIAKGLKTGDVKNTWDDILYVNGQVKHIIGIKYDTFLLNELRGINKADFASFVECGFFREIGINQFTLNEARIDNAIKNNFGEPMTQPKPSSPQKSYKSLSKEHWDFLVLMAKALRGKHLDSSNQKGCYIQPIIVGDEISEFKHFRQLFLQAHQNDLKISLKTFLDLAAHGFFEKARQGNYFLIEDKILPAVDDHLAQQSDAETNFSNILTNSRKLEWDIFMVMPFRDGLNDVYETVIIPTAKDLSLSIKRGDERQKVSASIVDEVLDYIKNAKIVLVDCSEIEGKPNGNVYYELGYADALGKDNVILISQTNATALPFDIKHRGVIEYQDNARGLAKLKEELKKAIQSILGED
jgi:hypothetical protein